MIPLADVGTKYATSIVRLQMVESLADLTHMDHLLEIEPRALQWHGGVGRAPVAPLDPPTRSGNRSPSGK